MQGMQPIFFFFIKTPIDGGKTTDGQMRLSHSYAAI